MSPERLRLVKPPVEDIGIEQHNGAVVSYVVTGPVHKGIMPDSRDINEIAFSPAAEPEVLSDAEVAIQDLNQAFDSYRGSTEALARKHIDEANYHSGQFAKLRIEDETNEAKKAELGERAVLLQTRVYGAQDRERMAKASRDEAQADHDAVHEQRENVFATLHGMLDQCHRRVKNDTENDAINDELRDYGKKILQITERNSDENLSDVLKLQKRLLVAETHLERKLKEHEASERALSAANEDLYNTFTHMEKLKESVTKTNQIHQKQIKYVQKGGKHARREPEASKRLKRAPLIGWLATRLLPPSPVEKENSQTIRLAEVER